MNLYLERKEDLLNLRFSKFLTVVYFVRLIQLCVVVLFFVVIAFVYSQDFTKIKDRISVVDSSYTVIGEITRMTPIKYEFNLRESDPLIGIRMVFADFVRDNDCLINVQLLIGTEERVNKDVKCESLPNNQFVEFKIVGSEEAKVLSSNYNLTISTPDGTPGNAVTMYRTNKPIYPKGVVTYGSEVVPGDLNIELIYGY